MVQAIENWAELAGTVREVRPAADASAMSQLVIHVEEANDVDGYPNLLADTPGDELAVSIKGDKLGDTSLEPGTKVRCRAQRASPSVVVAHPESLSKA